MLPVFHSPPQRLAKLSNVRTRGCAGVTAWGGSGRLAKRNGVCNEVCNESHLLKCWGCWPMAAAVFKPWRGRWPAPPAPSYNSCLQSDGWPEGLPLLEVFGVFTRRCCTRARAGRRTLTQTRGFPAPTSAANGGYIPDTSIAGRAGHDHRFPH